MIRSLILLLLATPAFADEELLACRDTQDPEKRVACYDRLVDSRYPRETPETTDNAETERQATSQPRIEQARINAPAIEPEVTQAPTHEPDNDSEELFGKPSQPLTTRTEIESTVRKVAKSAHRKLVITLDNQQIWQQLDSGAMRLHAGDTVTIKSAMLNSYQLRKTSGGKSIRVRRID